ncbi:MULTISPECIES: oligoendopeptidase F [Lacticaseibacillus]|uniref:Oligopeptidase F n=1 Tax=Lacticaseibacillus casei DSM 20011 = JCM 1134 = ATCC 393 TaxID=1423732 RepID=A0AAD1APB0_LACCA|nr:oligoendopeptidase F [Lacticaseibacillus casei]MBI6598269.1 oligoendopeptidase F [Lacticaseibacillus casei]MBO1481896.1 oligoendopeptidase F [Lacticaseibacillus casei]MBO2417176.1 oligoendopeptidase F [Lacticaseibacillus casei]MCK2081578.1 oligoendopeptidase F [Lacticaseibacillus casei]MDZ5496495.1 oligoendopeptidase F [Lacticaseibacillus casei]
MQHLPVREDVPTKLTWDLTTIYPNDAAWTADFGAVREQAKEATALKGTLGNSAAALINGIKAVLAVFRRFEKVYVYSSLKSDQDTGNATYQAMNAKAESLGAELASQLAFLDPEILAIPADKLAAWRDTESLKPFGHFIDAITVNRQHVLTAAAEALIASAGNALNASHATFNVLDNSDLQFGFVENEDGETVQLSNGLYGQLIRSTQRKLRKEAFETLLRAYESMKNTFAQTLSGQVKAHNFNAKAHHYANARAAAMASNHIPESVYTTLIDQVNTHLPLLHRYVALRKKVLGVDQLHMYDIYTPLTGKPPLTFTLDQAKAEALKALAPLGDDYLSHVREIFDNRYIDVVENKGKRSGAYSGGSYDTNPFILLNWHDAVDELYTLIHETGHSVHSWYTRHNQPYVYGDYPIFVAEIASTTNENLLTDYFLTHTDDPKVRAYILNYYLDGFKGTVFRQTQFTEFEHWIHQQDQQGEPLTATSMATYYADLNARYYGPDVARDPEIAFEWARIPHFYYNYYVYQYATGFAAASTLAAGISSGEPNAASRYLDYLKSGSSQYAIDTMKTAGVDMTKPDYLEAAFSMFEKRLTELEELLQKG